MSLQPRSNPLSPFKAPSASAGIITILVGCAVLIGWIFNITILKSIVPTWIAMTPNTAVLFILAGLALLLCRAEPAPRWLGYLSAACAGIVWLIAVLTLSQYLFNWNSGLDQLLFPDATAAFTTAYPGRLAAPTAVTFLLIASALLLFRTKYGWTYGLAELCASLALLMNLAVLLTYIYETSYLNGTTAYTQMALPTALAFMVLSTGVLLSVPDRRLLDSIQGKKIGSIMALRLVPAAILVPSILSWLHVEGERAGLYTSPVGAALLAVSIVSCLCMLILWSAQALNQIDTARKAVEATLSQSENLYHTLLEQASEAVFVCDAKGKFILVNQEACRMLGYTREDLLQRSMHDVLAPDELVARQIQFDALPVGKIPLNERSIIRKDQSHLLVEISTNVLADGRVQAIVRDITERKQAEVALHEERNLLRTLIDHLPDYVFTKDTAGRFVISNIAHAAAIQKSPEALIGKTAGELFPPELAAQYDADDAWVMQTGQALVNVERLSVDAAGNQRTVLSTKVPLRNHQGQLTGLVGISRDITERKRMEDALKGERNLLRTLLDNLPDAVYVKDSHSRFLLDNAPSRRSLGVAEQADTLGKRISTSIPATKPSSFMPTNNR